MGGKTCVQCQCRKCSKALAGFQYQAQDLKAKHEKLYPLALTLVPKHVSSIMPADLPGVQDVKIGAEDPVQQ